MARLPYLDKSDLLPEHQDLLARNLKTAQRDLDEAIFRTYRHVCLLGKDNKLRPIDSALLRDLVPRERAVLFRTGKRGDERHGRLRGKRATFDSGIGRRLRKPLGG